jgi:hypothetical protein
MKQPTNKVRLSLTSDLIAPCGMNCGVCSMFLREKKPCKGCLPSPLSAKPHPQCQIRACVQEKNHIRCIECAAFPCDRLQTLDRRYQTNYGVSLCKNLADFSDLGAVLFVHSESLKWECPHCHSRLSVHNATCLQCHGINPHFFTMIKTAPKK